MFFYLLLYAMMHTPMGPCSLPVPPVLVISNVV